MSTLYKAGRSLGAFQRGVVTCSPAAAGTSAAANLGDGDPSSPLLWGSLAVDSYGQADIQALTNGGFETAGLVGWTDGKQGTGTTTETTTAGEFRTGSRAVKLAGTNSSNYGSVYQPLVAYAGEWRQETVYIKTPTSGTAKMFLYNPKTGKFWNGSAWVTTRSAAVTQVATGSFVAMTVTFQMESFDACREDYVSLRWEIACESGTVCFDDCLSVFGVTFAAIFGHNLGPVVPTIRSSDDASAWSDRGTITIKRPACFTTFSIIYARYWRIVLVGTNHEIPYIGEAVVDQHQTSATPTKTGPGQHRSIPGARAMGASGRHHQYNYMTDPVESVSLMFQALTAAAAREISDAIWLRSGAGRYPVIFIPIATEANVYIGQWSEPIGEARPINNFWEYQANLAGLPFPTVGL